MKMTIYEQQEYKRKIRELKLELAEADRRAGAAERKLASVAWPCDSNEIERLTALGDERGDRIGELEGSLTTASRKLEEITLKLDGTRNNFERYRKELKHVRNEVERFRDAMQARPKLERLLWRWLTIHPRTKFVTLAQETREALGYDSEEDASAELESENGIGVPCVRDTNGDVVDGLKKLLRRWQDLSVVRIVGRGASYSALVKETGDALEALEPAEDEI